MKEFKVGDKVYFPGYGTGIFELEANSYNEDLEKYPFMIGAKTFTTHGETYERNFLQDIFHATPENHELLEKLYGVEFEKPPVKPTSLEIIRAMLARGDKYVPCWVSVSVEEPSFESISRMIYYIEHGEITYFIDDSGDEWKYATPFDPRTGEPITELPT